ncbi:uncharacterized protein LOC124268457 isoform X4 [Haliotis rubra]|uniref:uncharacterized protein LOC124268457 isoform X4 n=1 Tax=Haliotis rubra TaxID=36100 RepID=UPI001EE584B5|nr:uncharacterized protein LOC124268457 isoform X4 [Haliotis rubra]
MKLSGNDFLLCFRRVANTVTIFSRKLLSNISSFENIHDFLLFKIEQIRGVSTLDSKTKMRNDFENVNAPCSVIATILKRGGDNETQIPANMIRHTSVDDIPLHEDRESELKWLPQQAQGPEVYTFQKGTVCRVSKDEWLQRLLSFYHQPIWPHELTHRPQAVDTFGNMDSYRTSSSNNSICDRPTTFTDEGQGSSAETIKMVLLGSTGSGKSVTGNNILNRQIFHTGVSGRSQTDQCQRGETNRNGRQIQVIDTPGMFDTNMKIEEIAREVARCVWMTVPGIHAFVLVIKIDRFTDKEQSTVDLFSQIF